MKGKRRRAAEKYHQLGVSSNIEETGAAAHIEEAAGVSGEISESVEGGESVM